MSVFSGRFIAVVKTVAVRDIANAVMRRVDPDGGADTFTVALARPASPTVPVAWWASAALTPEQADFLERRAAVAIASGTRMPAGTPFIVEPGATPLAWSNSYVWFFRADEDLGGWTPEQVLDALGLVPITPVIAGATAAPA